MKKILYISFVFAASALLWTACKKSNYPGGQVYKYIPLLDLRGLYSGVDLALNEETMLGSTQITGLVISDHSGGNLPSGLLIIQDKRRLNKFRGIAIALGADAAKFVPGDSISVQMVGKTLTRRDGILQVQGVTMSDITKIASNVPVPLNPVPSSLILAKPDEYESTFVVIVDALFDPLPQPTDKYAGDKVINDGFDDFVLRTRSTANFANNGGLNFSANYYGIVLSAVNQAGKLSPYLAMNTFNNVDPVSTAAEPPAAAVITGYMQDPEGGDGNYDYMQFMATRDINFATTPYSVVVTNNAGTSVPTGVFPTKGWAIGIDAPRTPAGQTARSYKFNLNSGTVKKGEFFYVGGSARLINGANSTSISALKWIKAKNYTTSTPAANPAGNGEGFGLYTTNLLANSGNTSGFALFEGTNVDANSIPIDCIFIGNGGNVYSASPAAGFRVTRTDFYKRIDPITKRQQPFYLSGTNTIGMIYHPEGDRDKGYFNKLGGVYNTITGRWKKARAQRDIDLTKTATGTDLEGVTIQEILNDVGNVARRDTIAPTTLIPVN
ncbi:hypothetical protein C7T94_19125 [Pedobacter yulinensis]|uniref:DUF5689 domain-containing protein n=1 Tax=Pedobacter yulinensis TaxID=2126353 RepID=A0A2T3HGM3_9SPHI|nr:DUF5689 domain-containing protein [Pedobacter yulinensis]PST81596.1 hypothetical protein C7T94_19125 [Pedobacter yulinensis]